MVLSAKNAKQILEAKIAEKKRHEALEKSRKAEEKQHQKQLQKKLLAIGKDCLEKALEGAFSYEYCFEEEHELLAMVEARGFKVNSRYLEIDLLEQRVRAIKPSDRSGLLRRLENAFQNFRKLVAEHPAELEAFGEILDDFSGAPEPISHICHLVRALYDLNTEYGSDAALSLRLDAKIWAVLQSIQDDINLYDPENEVEEVERCDLSWQKCSGTCHEDSGDMFYARKLRCIALPEFQGLLQRFSKLVEASAQVMKSGLTMRINDGEDSITVILPDQEEFEFRITLSDFQSIFKALGYSIKFYGERPEVSMEVSF